jgi:hypothetical protein
MRTLLVSIGLAAALLPGSTANAEKNVFFAEHFDGPTLDPAIWRTEVLTSGPRWCQETEDYWGPGLWVDEGVDCHGIAIHAPYGSATLSDGWLHFSSNNDHAYPMLYSRLPGSVQVFPTTGDFSFTLRLRYDLLTGYGSGLIVYRAVDTEPAGDGPPHGRQEDIALHMGTDAAQGGLRILTALDGSYRLVGVVPVDPTEPHEVKVAWIGSSAEIRVDGEIIYGPVSTSLRPTAVLFANHPLYWYLGGAWTAWSLDEFRVETEGTTQAADESWGAIKARFGEPLR